MSIIYDCKYVIKGKPVELAEFVKNHISYGQFNLESLGIDYPEYFNTENPYNPRKILEYDIRELNIWLTVVKRSNFKRRFVEEDIFEAIKVKYPHLEVNYGYIDYGSEGFFHFPGGIIRSEGDNLENFKIDYEFKPIETFNKLVLEGEYEDLAAFLENEVEFGKLKSHKWAGNDLQGFKNRIVIYFEGISYRGNVKTLDYILSKYPQFHIKMYTLAIGDKLFRIREKGKEMISISMETYEDYENLISEYKFFEGLSDPAGYFVENAFNTLVFKACERYRYKNKIYHGLSLKMYRLKARSGLSLYYC